MGEYPEQLAGETDRSYGHFCAWLDFDGRERKDATRLFAVARGVKPDQVRRLRSRYGWAERAAPVPTVEQEVRARTKELTVERTAQTLAQRAAEARINTETGHAFLGAKVINKALQAVANLDPDTLDNADIVRLMTLALRELGPAKGTAVSVRTDGAQGGGVEVVIAELAELPADQQAIRASAIIDEAARQAEVIGAYYASAETSK